MRTANGREPQTGAGHDSGSWIGLAIGMVVLDTLTPESEPVGQRWERLLTSHGITEGDARAIYKLRCSLVHGYYLPEPRLIGGRSMQLTADRDTYAVDTETEGLVSVSVPVFTRCLVERIAFEARDEWDETLIDTDALDKRRR